MPERIQKPQDSEPFKKEDNQDPKKPEVNRPEKKDLLDRMKRVDPNQAKRYFQRSGQWRLITSVG